MQISKEYELYKKGSKKAGQKWLLHNRTLIHSNWYRDGSNDTTSFDLPTREDLEKASVKDGLVTVNIQNCRDFTDTGSADGLYFNSLTETIPLIVLRRAYALPMNLRQQHKRTNK